MCGLFAHLQGPEKLHRIRYPMKNLFIMMILFCYDGQWKSLRGAGLAASASCAASTTVYYGGVDPFSESTNVSRRNRERERKREEREKESMFEKDR